MRSPVVLALLLVPTLALASSQAQGETEAASWFTLGFALCNFAVFVYLLRRFSRRPLRDFLVGRRQKVSEALAEAARAKAEAESAKRAYETRAEALEQTRRDMLEEVRAMALADRERLLDAARETGERLKKDSARTARSDLENARRQLRAEAARLAREIAGSRITERIGSVEKSRLVENFLASVEQE